MDYLYINAIVNEIYTDIPSNSDFPKEYRDNVVRISQSLDCLSANAPDHVFSFYSVKAPNLAPLMVMSRVQKHTNCSSVGRLTQCQGWNFNRDLVLDQIDQIFSTGFYTEAEVDAMARSGRSVPLSGRFGQESPAAVPELSVPVKTAILSAVFRRWLRGDPALRIAVPAGVDYDSYVLGAVRAIYALFPAAMRLEAGFCSFLADANSCSKEIGLGFIPEIMSDSNTLRLDGTNIGSRGTANTSRRTLDRFVEYLASLDPQSLKAYLRQVNQDLEGGDSPEKISGITAQKYGTLAETLKLLSLEGTQKEMIPVWVNFYKNINNYTDTDRSRVIRKIQESIRVPEFCGVYADICAGSTPEQMLDALQDYAPLCEDNPALAEGLRQTLLEALKNKKLTAEETYRRIESARRKYPRIFSEDSVEQLGVDALYEKFHRIQNLPVADRSGMDNAESQAAHLLTEIRKSGLRGTEALQLDISRFRMDLQNRRQQDVVKQFRTRVDQLKLSPAVTAADLEALVSNGSRLLQEITEHPQREALREPEEDLKNFVLQKQQLLNSSSAKYQKLAADLRRTHGYFEKLELASKHMDAMTEESQRQELSRMLSAVSPRTLGQFQDQFKARYGQKLTLEAIGKQPQLAAAQMTRDLGSLENLCVDLTDKKYTVKQMREKIQEKIKLAPVIREHCPVVVAYKDFKDLDARWFYKVLTLKDDVPANGSDLRNVVAALNKDGLYDKKELEEFLHSHPSARPASRKKSGGKKKKKTGLIVSICLLVLLLAAVSVLAIFFLLRGEPEEVPVPTVETTTVVTQPVETEPPVLPEAETEQFKLLLKQGELLQLLYPEDAENSVPQRLADTLTERFAAEFDTKLIGQIYASYQTLPDSVSVGDTGAIAPELYLAYRYWYYLMQKDQGVTWNQITEKKMDDLLSLIYYQAAPRFTPDVAEQETTAAEAAQENVKASTAAPKPKEEILQMLREQQWVLREAYRTSHQNTALLQTWVALYGPDGSRSFDEIQTAVQTAARAAKIPDEGQALEAWLVDHRISAWSQETGVSREVHSFWSYAVLAVKAQNKENWDAHEKLKSVLELMAVGSEEVVPEETEAPTTTAAKEESSGAAAQIPETTEEAARAVLDNMVEAARKAYDSAREALR